MNKDAHKGRFRGRVCNVTCDTLKTCEQSIGEWLNKL